MSQATKRTSHETVKPVLSLDAKATLGCLFQHGMVLSFRLEKSRPTLRLQAALDELVKAEMIVKTNMPTRADGSCGVKYRARVPTDSYRRFARKANIVLAEPIVPVSAS